MADYAHVHIAGIWADHLREERSLLEEKAPETGALFSIKLLSSASFTAAAVT